MGFKRNKHLPMEVDIHAHCADTCKDFAWLDVDFLYSFFPKCFAQVLSGEQRKTEELTTVHKILYIFYSFSSPNRDTGMETEIQLTK